MAVQAYGLSLASTASLKPLSPFSRAVAQAAPVVAASLAASATLAVPVVLMTKGNAFNLQLPLTSGLGALGALSGLAGALSARAALSGTQAWTDGARSGVITGMLAGAGFALKTREMGLGDGLVAGAIMGGVTGAIGGLTSFKLAN